MRRLLEIGAWAITTLALFAATLVSPIGAWVVQGLPNTRLNRFERAIQQLDGQLAALESASLPRNIIIGPSYAADVGSLPNLFNLSIMGMSPGEVCHFISKFCDPSDNVFYICAPPDSIFGSRLRPNIQWITVKALRRLTLIKSSIINPVAPPRKVRVAANALTSEEKQKVLGFFGQPQNYKPFKDLKELVPNITFILHPTNTLEPFGFLQSNCTEFHEGLALYGISFVDMSDVLRQSDFRGFCHLNPSGIKRLREILTSYIQISSQNISIPRNHPIV